MLTDDFQVLPCVLDIDLIQATSHPKDLLGMYGNVRDLALQNETDCEVASRSPMFAFTGKEAMDRLDTALPILSEDMLKLS